MEKAALLSVSDRTNLKSLAETLSLQGFTILASSGTCKFLEEAGITVLPIEQYTGQREILGGRVKTLHPKIHAGILARRDNPDDMRELQEQGILPIDVVVVNLYPFERGLESERVDNPHDMVGLIDIGGPTMIRGAAKNYAGVIALIDPADYERVGICLQRDGVPLEVREELAVKVFARLADYNLQIARYFSQVRANKREAVDGAPPISGSILKIRQSLRYGENPHQRAALYAPLAEKDGSWRQHSGKELSYNNLLDFDAACRVVRSFRDYPAVAAIIKHANPCGFAVGNDQPEALRKAKLCDPRSHFGGIIAFNGRVESATANEITQDFAEVVLAPEFSMEALEKLAGRKNLRVLEVDLERPAARELRSVLGGVLVQEGDAGVSAIAEAEQKTSRVLSEQEQRDIELAWRICAHVKSNAVVIVRDGMLIGCGAGQMSRVDATEIALWKASVHKHIIEGAVAASDAFFPFADSLESLAAAGVKAVIAPKGSRADDDVARAAEQLGISLLFTSDRHFRH